MIRIFNGKLSYVADLDGVCVRCKGHGAVDGKDGEGELYCPCPSGRELRRIDNGYKAMREAQNAELSKVTISRHAHPPPSGFEAYWAECERMAEEMAQRDRQMIAGDNESSCLASRFDLLDKLQMVLAVLMMGAVWAMLLHWMGAR